MPAVADDTSMSATVPVHVAPTREALLRTEGIRMVVREGRIAYEFDVLDEQGEVLRTFECEVDTGVVSP